MPAPPASEAKSVPRTPHSQGRLALLVALLVAAAAALPVSRMFLGRGAPPPPPGANLPELRVHYLRRVEADPADVESHLRLAETEERLGLLNSALQRAEVAAALGAPGWRVAGIRGRCLTQLGRFDQARQELEKAARLNPDSAEAAMDLAALFVEVDRPGDGAKIVRLFLKHRPHILERPTPEDRRALERITTLARMTGDAETGLRASEQLVRLLPGQPDGYAMAGRFLLGLRCYADAAERLQKACELAPDVSQLHNLRALALMKTGRRNEALQALQKATLLDPEDADSFFEIGREYARRKDWPRAGYGFMRAAGASGHTLAYRHAAEAFDRAGMKVEAAYCRARSAATNGDAPAALREFLKVARSPDPVWRRQGLLGAAEALQKMNRLKEHVEMTRRATRAGTAEDHILMADAYGAALDYENRKVELKRALAKDPSVAGHVHHQLGTICEAGGLRDEAEREYEAAVAAAPDNPTYYRELADLYMERRSLDGRLQKAVALNEKLLRMVPGEAQDYVRLGLGYKEMGDLGRAIAAFQRAIDLDAGYGPAYQELGRVLIASGRREAGREMMRLYRRYQDSELEKRNLIARVQADKKDGSRWVALADYFLRARDYGQARTYYERALYYDPKCRQARERLARLARIALGHDMADSSRREDRKSGSGL